MRLQRVRDAVRQWLSHQQSHLAGLHRSLDDSPPNPPALNRASADGVSAGAAEGRLLGRLEQIVSSKIDEVLQADKAPGIKGRLTFSFFRGLELVTSFSCTELVFFLRNETRRCMFSMLHTPDGRQFEPPGNLVL